MQRPEYHIIVKVFKQQASSAERNLVASWLRDSSLKRQEYQRLRKIWDEYGMHHESYPVDFEHDFNELTNSISSTHFRFNDIFKVAASIALLFIIGLSIYRATFDTYRKEQVFTSDIDGKEIILEDGSIVVLRAGSELRLSQGFNQNDRKLELYGEAYFDVSHDIEKPFIVQTAGLSVEVFGTSFLIIPLSERTEVALLSGKVDVYTHEQRISLISNQTAIFKDKMLSIESVSENSMSWWTKELDFKEQTLKQVFKDLERHYQVRMELDEGVADKLLTTSFYDQPIEEVLAVISNIHQLEIKRRTKNHYYILRK